MSNSRQEIFIIGSGVGGLSAGIHSALLGGRAVVLEQAAQPGGKAAQWQADGFTFDPGPSIIIMPWVYEEVFRRAGKPMEDYLRFRRLDPLSRVVLEGGEALDLPADESALLDVIAERAPEDHENFKLFMAQCERFYGAVRPTVFNKPFLNVLDLLNPGLIRSAGAIDTRSPYKSLVDRWFRSDLLRAFFYGFPSYSGFDYHDSCPGALLIPYLMIREGVWYPEGGVGAIPAAFYRLAQELGVEFRFNARVVGFETNGRKIAGVQLEGGETLRAQRVISNLDRLTAQSLLGHTVDLPPSYSYFTLQFGLRRRLTGAEHHMLLIPHDYPKAFEALYDRKEMPTNPVIYLNVPSAIDPGCAPDGCENVFIVQTAPAMEPHFDWDARQAELRDRALDSLRRYGLKIGPEELVAERVQTPAHFARAHGNYLGSLYGPVPKHRFLGLFPLTNRDDRFRNLWYAGGSVQPGAGLPMVTLSGRFAAELACR